MSAPTKLYERFNEPALPRFFQVLGEKAGSDLPWKRLLPERDDFWSLTWSSPNHVNTNLILNTERAFVVARFQDGGIRWKGLLREGLEPLFYAAVAEARKWFEAQRPKTLNLDALTGPEGLRQALDALLPAEFSPLRRLATEWQQDRSEYAERLANTRRILLAQQATNWSILSNYLEAASTCKAKQIGKHFWYEWGNGVCSVWLLAPTKPLLGVVRRAEVNVHGGGYEADCGALCSDHHTKAAAFRELAIRAKAMAWAKPAFVINREESEHREEPGSEDMEWYEQVFRTRASGLGAPAPVIRHTTVTPSFWRPGQ